MALGLGLVGQYVTSHQIFEGEERILKIRRQLLINVLNLFFADQFCGRLVNIGYVWLVGHFMTSHQIFEGLFFGIRLEEPWNLEDST